ncbi:MAG: hypothetical protein ACYCVZ_17975 [Streptosporangiaceae bacterium]
MPCYRCGTRQVDPDRGSSPWRRGVRANRQVLICPDCQVLPDLAGDLDRCPECGGARLGRRLGEVECRDCGAVTDQAIAAPGLPADGDSLVSDGHDRVASDLAEEVEQALRRVLRRFVRSAPIG